MLCFRDMTFCRSDCTNKECWRHFGPDDQAAARAWLGEDAPVDFADFSHDCPDYQPPASTGAEGVE